MAVAYAQWVASTLAMLTPKFAFALHHSDTLPIAFAFLRLCVLVFAFAMALARLKQIMHPSSHKLEVRAHKFLMSPGLKSFIACATLKSCSISLHSSGLCRASCSGLSLI